MIAPFLFFILAIGAVAAALGMIIARNPVNSALLLVLNLFCIAGLYLTLNAQFIAVIQVLVYAGAIMVLFLFVIMLLNLAEMPRPQQFRWSYALALVLGALVLAQAVYVIAEGLNVIPAAASPEQAAATGTAKAIAMDLFTTYMLPFEMIGILLLVATIGAVMLAKRRFI